MVEKRVRFMEGCNRAKKLICSQYYTCNIGLSTISKEIQSIQFFKACWRRLRSLLLVLATGVGDRLPSNPSQDVENVMVVIDWA
jgi:hypothetical protein